jgi:H/ACA ribonucleoprotein complex subunit 4
MDISKSVLLLDKPSGPTSFDCVERVEKILRSGKAGHTGTLDPNVTGLLVIAVGEAKKAMPLMAGLDKEYVGKMILHRPADKKEIAAVFKKFIGEIEQLPPVKSRVARKPRKRKIYNLEILSIRDRRISFRVRCEAGTYIRKLCHDIGIDLGSGAQMTELRRTKVGEFSVDDAITLKDLEDGSRKGFLALEDALEKIHAKKISVRPEFAEKIRNGLPVRREWTTHIDQKIKAGDHLGIFIAGQIAAVGISRMDLADMKAGSVIAKTDRVFKF